MWPLNNAYICYESQGGFLNVLEKEYSSGFVVHRRLDLPDDVKLPLQYVCGFGRGAQVNASSNKLESFSSFTVLDGHGYVWRKRSHEKHFLQVLNDGEKLQAHQILQDPQHKDYLLLIADDVQGSSCLLYGDMSVSIDQTPFTKMNIVTADPENDYSVLGCFGLNFLTHHQPVSLHPLEWHENNTMGRVLLETEEGTFLDVAPLCTTRRCEMGKDIASIIKDSPSKRIATMSDGRVCIVNHENQVMVIDCEKPHREVPRLLGRERIARHKIPSQPSHSIVKFARHTLSLGCDGKWRFEYFCNDKVCDLLEGDEWGDVNILDVLRISNTEGLLAMQDIERILMVHVNFIDRYKTLIEEIQFHDDSDTPSTTSMKSNGQRKNLTNLRQRPKRAVGSTP